MPFFVKSVHSAPFFKFVFITLSPLCRVMPIVRYDAVNATCEEAL
nr:MAG TPA: hypothetical protein [Caudoviricetes sp.]